MFTDTSSTWVSKTVTKGASHLHTTRSHTFTHLFAHTIYREAEASNTVPAKKMKSENSQLAVKKEPVS